MSQVIIFKQDNGSVGVVYPGTSGAPVEEIANQMVPSGAERKIVDFDSLPAEQVFFNAWEYNDGVSVNITKAREIVHVLRRAARAVEFAPYDDIIAKQIPGEDAAEAEAERQKIREKYEAIQADIDAESNFQNLKAIYDSLLIKE